MTCITRLSAAVIGGLALAACSDSAGPNNGLPSCGAHGTRLSLGVGQYALNNAVTDSGCVRFAANTSSDTAEYLVLPWSDGGDVSSGGQPSAPFTLQSATAVTAALMAQNLVAPGSSRFRTGRAQGARGPAAVAFDRFLRTSWRGGRFLSRVNAPVQTSAVANAIAAGPPSVGDKRTFRVCASLDLCKKVDTVGAVARSVGTHIAIYIDTLAPSPGLSQSDLDSLKSVFDSRLYALDTTTFGGVSDIDSNTVVIVLMTNTVNKLVSASRCTTDGYIAGFFFPLDLASSTWNNGEIFYSIVADPNGTLSCTHTVDDVNKVMPVTFTHEFQHMINFAQHFVMRSCQCSEDGWLDEGLSKYAEEIAGRSFLLDGDSAAFSQYAIGDVYDAYQYLSSPQSSPLLIPEDTGSLAEVGASWLFTRFIVDRFGNALPGKLVRTAMYGIQNVETQTGQAFDSTVTQWSLANWVASFSTASRSAFPAQLQYTTWDFRHTFDTVSVQDPTDFPRRYPLVPTIVADNAVNLSGTLRAGTGYYLRVMQPPNGAEFGLRFTGPGGAAVSQTVVPRLNILRIR